MKLARPVRCAISLRPIARGRAWPNGLRAHALASPIEQAANLVASLARAVNHIHTRGVLHRDIKPSNVLLEPLDEGATTGQLDRYLPKLTDFGLAKLLEREHEATRSGTAIGTPAYMAPEQARGVKDQIGPATDVYGLGAVLYELLTRCKPFDGPSEADCLRLILSSDPVRPRRVRSEIRRDLEAICLKCLEKDPKRRYATAGALAADLERYLAGAPTQARPLPTYQRLVRWTRRQPAVASLAAGVLLLLLTVATVSTVAAIRIDESRRGAEAIAEREAAAKDQAIRLRVQSERDLREIQARDRQLWRSLYGTRIRRAFDAYGQGRADLLTTLLEDCRPAAGRDDLRGFEWHYLLRKLEFVGRTDLISEGGPCYFVTYSPDGKQILAGTEGGFVNTWDASTFAPVRRFQAHASCVNDIRFSPDGQKVATVSCDNTTRLWHAPDWQPAGAPMQSDQPVFRSVFTPDGKLLITTPDTRKLPFGTLPKLTVWDVATGEPRHRETAALGMIYDLDLALEGRRIVTINEFHVIQEWDLDGAKLTPVQYDLTPATPREYCALRLCPDQRTIVYSDPRSGVQTADIVTGERRPWPQPWIVARVGHVARRPIRRVGRPRYHGLDTPSGRRFAGRDPVLRGKCARDVLLAGRSATCRGIAGRQGANHQARISDTFRTHLRGSARVELARQDRASEQRGHATLAQSRIVARGGRPGNRRLRKSL